MGHLTLTPSLKKEAAGQIVGRGYPVSEVSERLGVSAYSAFKWVVMAIQGIRTPDLRIIMKIAPIFFNKINGLQEQNPTV